MIKNLFLLTLQAIKFVLLERKFEHFNKPFLIAAIFGSTAVLHKIHILENIYTYIYINIYIYCIYKDIFINIL